jgi:flavin-dependent dehydrogenase
MYDVIVIGGGPGGSAAAIACAKANLRVLLLEKYPFPRHRPGETLHPGIEPLLKQLGVLEAVLSAGFLRHLGNWVKWERDLQFTPFGEDENGVWQGFQAWRADFDLLLLDRAKAIGVDVIQPCHAIRPIVREDRVTGVETSQGIFEASVVIDAAGSHHWLAKQLRLSIKTYSAPLIARYGYVRGQCPIRDDAPAIIADDRGWTWMAKIRPDLYQWTRLTFKPERIDRDWVPEEFSYLQAVNKSRAADVTWRSIDRPAGLGYFTIGDAATVLDPSSSHGVLKAMMSGMMAGHSIAQIIDRTQPEYVVTQLYCEWTHNWFQHDLTRLIQLYDLLSPENISTTI